MFRSSASQYVSTYAPAPRRAEEKIIDADVGSGRQWIQREA